MLNFLWQQKSCFYFTCMLSESLCRGWAWLPCRLELLPLTHLQRTWSSAPAWTHLVFSPPAARLIWLFNTVYTYSASSTFTDFFPLGFLSEPTRLAPPLFLSTQPPSSPPPAFPSVSHSPEPQRVWAYNTCWATCLSLSCLPLPATRPIQTHPFNLPPCFGSSVQPPTNCYNSDAILDFL